MQANFCSKYVAKYDPLLALRRKMSSAHNKFEDTFQMAKTADGGMDILLQNLESLSLLF
jgi:hypothetical protein